MARLLLTNPYYLKDDPVTRQAMDIYPLLGHGYLASHLETLGSEVAIFDGTFEKGIEAFVNALDATKSDVVGVYGHVLSRSNAFQYAHVAKQRGVLALAGGPDATGYYDEYLTNGFDVVVRSEGEETAAELMTWYTAGAHAEELSRIPGIAYRDSTGAVVLNPDRPFIGDLDGLRFPRRDEHNIPALP